MSYSEVENSAMQRAARFGADELIRRVLSNSGFGFPPEQFRGYLELLRKNAVKYGAAGASGPQQLGTLIVNRGADGQVRFVTCDITRTHEMTLEISSGLERDARSRGHSRDMGWSR